MFPIQRRRRRDYHRAKQESDPEYRQVCRDSRKKWRNLHPGYQRDYRERHPEYAERNRQAQRVRNGKRRLADLVKNSLALELKPCPGEVWLAEVSRRCVNEKRSSASASCP